MNRTPRTRFAGGIVLGMLMLLVLGCQEKPNPTPIAPGVPDPSTVPAGQKMTQQQMEEMRKRHMPPGAR